MLEELVLMVTFDDDMVALSEKSLIVAEGS